MTLPLPNLDDRSFQDLMAEARQLIPHRCPEWTDLSPGDPGGVLLELFAHLTELMLYRVNRIPEKAYVEFLNLLGVQLTPPRSAQVELQFRLSVPPTTPMRVPEGTQVTTAKQKGQSESPRFTTIRDAVFQPGQTHLLIPASHCERIIGELAAVKGTGQAGQTVLVRRPPIVESQVASQDLLVGVELVEGESAERMIRFQGKSYEVWTEVAMFGPEVRGRPVYCVDRVAGQITFAPALRTMSGDDPARQFELLAQVPAAGREIRIWYDTGGGREGNVSAGTLTVLKDPLPGVEVTNPSPAVGGRDVESLQNALLRGPYHAHAQERLVTARDYEQIILRKNPAEIARVVAYTKSKLWAHGTPGTVQVALLPTLPSTDPPPPLNVQEFERCQSAVLQQSIRKQIDDRRPLGTAVDLDWIELQEVSVHARLTLHEGENAEELRAQAEERLTQWISPVPTPRQPQGWPFGEPLSAGRVYDELLSLPGIKRVDHLRLHISEVPTGATVSVAADAHQNQTWFVISGNHLYRTLDDGGTWRRVSPVNAMSASDVPVPGELVKILTHPTVPGHVAVVIESTQETPVSSVVVSRDCGTTWSISKSLGFEVHDACWIQRSAGPALLLATARGLFEWAVEADTFGQILLHNFPPDIGFYSLAVLHDRLGDAAVVAVAARNFRGVWISYERGLSLTYIPIGLTDEDVRTLVFEKDQSRQRLWAGTRVVGDQPGHGCFAYRGPETGWTHHLRGWMGGSCLALSVSKERLFAATFTSGVVELPLQDIDRAEWSAVEVHSGDLSHSEDFRTRKPVRSLDVQISTEKLMCGTDAGVFIRTDPLQSLRNASQAMFIDGVPLPPYGLFCSGRHQLQIVVRDETSVRYGQ